MLKKIWRSLACNKRNLESANEGHELTSVDDAALQRTSGEVSNHLDIENWNCEVEADQEVPPVFAALQLYDIDELTRLLDESPNLINKTKCGGLAPLHVACHLKSLQILQIILNHGALVDNFDDVGNTALHIAINEDWHEGVTELLLQGASPNIKSQPLEIDGEVTAETPLHAAVRRGDLDATLLVLEYKPDLTLRDGNQCSVLHLAAQSLNLQIVQRLLQEKQCQQLLDTGDSTGNSIMHAAITTPGNTTDETLLEEILRAFFEAGVNVNCVNLFNESPVFCAARAGSDKAVEFLLSLGPELQTLTSQRQSLLHGACLSGSASCLKHLLNTGCLHHFVTQADDDGMEPFHYAILSSSIDSCELLLSNGDHLTRTDKYGSSRCSLILDYLPSATELLEHLFNNCINLSDKPQHDPDFRICFDYSILLSPSENIQCSFQSSVISDLNDNNKSESLLKHPLVESFLYRKWSKIRIFFYTNVFIFFLFLLLHSFYIISVFKKAPMTFSKYIFSIWLFRFLHIFMYLLILIPEVIITVSDPKRHMRHWESLTKLTSLVSSALVVFSQVSEQDVETNGVNFNMTGITTNNGTTTTTTTTTEQEMSFQRYVAAISAFFGWVELMMLFGRFPALGVYALMFTRIAKSMILFISAFITLLIGFAICFLVLFYENPLFASFWQSFVKTLMMMVGEIGYEDLVDGNSPVISYVMLVAFLFLVSILVVNLLIGLAVNDISNLELMGKIERLSKQASFLFSLEKLITCVRRWRIFPHSLVTFLSTITNIKPRLNISLNKRRFKSNWKYKIPAEIIEAALAIGNSNEDSFVKSNYENTDVKLSNDKQEPIQEKLDKILKILETLHPELKSELK